MSNDDFELLPFDVWNHSGTTFVEVVVKHYKGQDAEAIARAFVEQNKEECGKIERKEIVVPQASKVSFSDEKSWDEVRLNGQIYFARFLGIYQPGK